MKTKDQLQLELLYEQIVDSPFQMLKEEEEFFNFISDKIAELIVKNKEKMEKYFYDNVNRSFTSLKHSFFGNFTVPQFVYNFFNENVSEELYKALNLMYTSWILDEAFKTIQLKKVHFSKTIKFCLEFNSASNPDEDGILTDAAYVDIEDKEGLKKAFKDSFEKALRFLYNVQKTTPSFILSTHRWYEWRKERVAYEPLRNKLPELKGIF